MSEEKKLQDHFVNQCTKAARDLVNKHGRVCADFVAYPSRETDEGVCQKTITYQAPMSELEKVLCKNRELEAQLNQLKEKMGDSVKQEPQ